MKPILMTALCLTITVSGACSMHEPADRSVDLESWGDESQIKDYHNPIIFEITVTKSGYVFNHTKYSLSQVEDRLREISSLKPKPVLIVRREMDTSHDNFYKFLLSVDANFGCSPIICLVGN